MFVENSLSRPTTELSKFRYFLQNAYENYFEMYKTLSYASNLLISSKNTLKNLESLKTMRDRALAFWTIINAFSSCKTVSCFLNLHSQISGSAVSQARTMFCDSHCSLLLTTLFGVVTPDCGLIPAQKYCSMLLTTQNNMGSTKLLKTVMKVSWQVVRFYAFITWWKRGKYFSYFCWLMCNYSKSFSIKILRKGSSNIL